MLLYKSNLSTIPKLDFKSYRFKSFFFLELISLFNLNKKQNSILLMLELNFIKVLTKTYLSYLQNIWCEAH